MKKEMQLTMEIHECMRKLREMKDDDYFEMLKEHEEKTYNYFMKLTLGDQIRYYETHPVLKYYKNDALRGVTNDRFENARRVVDIVKTTGLKFDNLFI